MSSTNLHPEITSDVMECSIYGVVKIATLKAFPMLLETLAEEGYEFCSLDENLKPIQYKRK